MRESLVREVQSFVLGHDLNNLENDTGPYFLEPMVGFSSVDDQLFNDYKRIIGEFHMTPREMFENKHGAGSLAKGTVICWILPINKETIRSNRRETVYPTRNWAHTRFFGEQFNVEIRKHIGRWLTDRGYTAVAPFLSDKFRQLDSPPAGVASTWSERHAAFASGLGTFGLCDGLITRKGKAHRIGSVVTDLVIEPDKRPYTHHNEYCLHYNGRQCAACVPRCPVDALSKDNGHDKYKCREYVYQTVVEAVSGGYGVKESGCGLCQTKVPCETMIPVASVRDRLSAL
jgi:epoxyqueuosine reductase QueG